MTADLRGCVAIVTGAGRGLGREFAVALAGAGAAVTVAARTAAQLEALAAEVTAAGGRALACTTDVRDEASVEHMVEATLETFGRIDVLVNNSGILASSALLDQSLAEWQAVFDTNVRGCFLATRAVGRHLVAQGSGKIVNVASNFARMGVANHAAYSASKAAICGFTRSMAIEWARYNVQVNALAPGYFATDLNAELRSDAAAVDRVLRAIPARRMGVPGDLTSWLLLLASRASDFMTGEVIVVDGGQSIR
jgi:NAD(P)-dependent dehydrogenase (short-subunit alcohol dehydrogenase family)